ncbi:hypothetical protein DB31_5138 [Hyalangium minutum]|uniref:Uncharacterized protein n=1 Tax=Hyalangium minutum TaxID=394096 RepID=A0A085WQY3_9BACT|nr:hypothetical protein DB31_5138 [Hyalangium minutum]
MHGGAALLNRGAAGLRGGGGSGRTGARQEGRTHRGDEELANQGDLQTRVSGTGRKGRPPNLEACLLIPCYSHSMVAGGFEEMS